MAVSLVSCHSLLCWSAQVIELSQRIGGGRKKRDTDRNRVRELFRWNNGQSQHFYSVQRIIQSSSRIDSRIRRELSETLYYYYPLVA